MNHGRNVRTITAPRPRTGQRTLSNVRSESYNSRFHPAKVGLFSFWSRTWPGLGHSARPIASKYQSPMALDTAIANAPSRQHHGRKGAGARFRLAVRPTDRPPRSRAERLLRDRPPRHHARAAPRARAQGDHSLRRPVQRLRTGRSASAIPGIFRLGIPVLGICYGMQLACEALGGKVDSAPAREFGRANCEITSRRRPVRRRARAIRKSG